MGKWIGPRVCWFCGKKLQLKRGGGYHYATIKDPIGNELRIHLACTQQAIGNGYIEVKSVTSTPAQLHGDATDR